MPLSRRKPDSLAFRCRLDFAPAIRHLGGLAEKGQGLTARLAREVLAEAASHPFLKGPIDDLGLLKDIPDLVQLLLSPAIPIHSESERMIAAAVPLSFGFAFATPSFRKAMESLGPGDQTEDDHEHLFLGWNIILQMKYGLPKQEYAPWTLSIPMAGRIRHFQMEIDPSWIDLHVNGSLPDLSAADLAALRSRTDDLELYSRLLPPSKFEFRGFIVMQAIDITAQQQLSELKQAVLEKNSVLDTEKFERIQALLRDYLGKPDLGLGIAAIRGDEVLYLNHAAMCDAACIYTGSNRSPVSDFNGTLFEKAVQENRPCWKADLRGQGADSAMEQEMLDHGVGSYVMLPLPGPAGAVGALILKSPSPGDIGPHQAEMLSELVPLFGNSVERSLDEFEDRVQIVMQDRFTSIHPSVAWRFRDEAARLIETARAGEIPEVRPIIFPDVHPLYSVTDIRASSSHRNEAIQADLLAHVKLAREVFRAAFQHESLPVYDEVGYRLDRYHDALLHDMSTGDEIQVIAFLREVVESSFEDLSKYGKDVEQKIAKYRKAIDPHAGTVYRKRKDFDESVAEINRVASTYLEEADAEAQKMFPHYFDKQATDGVDQNLYIGASIAGKRKFGPMHLRNMRLWQFITLCTVARKMDALKPTLPVPLDTTHLIMVQDMPITIRFDADEKKFRVDGAYNIRYEIMKKRIDKAVILGSGERLTQPGRIAVVYSHAREAAEYREFIDYLSDRGFLEGETEEMELEDLQGIKGLRALRVRVRLAEAAASARELAEAAFAV